MVFTPWIASKPTLVLNSAPNTFRFVPLIARFLLASDYSLNYCLKFGVPYKATLHQSVVTAQKGYCLLPDIFIVAGMRRA